MTEQVNHPAHYGGKDNVYEVLKVCRAWLTPEEYIGALKFQVWKYTARHRQKGGLVDLEKAQFYQNELVRFEREREEWTLKDLGDNQWQLKRTCSTL